ncbi:AraC family transcriptional regulator [Parapedobacter sp. 10938]|uniref:AraC family transcriptional regulator n=1 Tax=Parapedobacter flavus TaxID=3110225 RepID=UPI002DB87291|nr:AraC family transcriptional regulator [Parapedobacter sp. 10938]MEC3878442.1 AraC family transcriptional regulator [Parapedobacter sp. 10938]
MVPIARPIPILPTQSFAVRHLRGEDCDIPYHVHDAHELILIRSGSGSFYVGNAIRRFQAGDVFLLAPGVPHWFRCERLPAGSPNTYEFIVLQFYKSFLGERYFDLPEHGQLKRLFSTTGLALSFNGSTRDMLAEWLLSMLQVIGHRRLMLVLRVLATLGNNPDTTSLQQAITTDIGLGGMEGLEHVRRFINEHLRERIYLEDAASLLHMSVATFCRYFKQCTGRTFVDFVQEVRIAHACDLLKVTDLPIPCVCRDSGFHSMAHFIRVFKRLKRLTPHQFRAAFS